MQTEAHAKSSPVLMTLRPVPWLCRYELCRRSVREGEGESEMKQAQGRECGGTGAILR